MLTSLFGELGAALDPFSKKPRPNAPGRSFAATTIMDGTGHEADEQGPAVDRNHRDLVVTGSPAHAIREHLAATRSDLDNAGRMISLYDPMQMWAASIIKALSDAGGRPIERLNLREQTSLRTMAVIERATLLQRNDDALKVYHADVRLPGSDNAEIPIALMERSHLTAVIAGPMDPPTVDAMLVSLQAAVSLPTWRCPNLLFLLPPSAVWMANRIRAVTWPDALKVHALNEPMTSASAVWNALHGYWHQVKTTPPWSSPALPAMLGVDDFPIKVAELGQAATQDQARAASQAPLLTPNVASRTSAAPIAAGAAVVRTTRSTLDPEHARKSMREMLGVEGLVGCAVVDAGNGLVLAREQRADEVVDIDRVAAACAQVLRAHRLAARSMGLQDHVDEVMVSAGDRQQIIRTVTRHPELFVFVLLDRQRASLALARYKLMEVEKGLL